MEANASPIHDCLFQGLELINGPSCVLHEKSVEASAFALEPLAVKAGESTAGLLSVIPTDEIVPDEIAAISEQFALVSADNEDYLCDENLYYDDEYEETCDDDLEPENSFHSLDLNSFFVKTLSAIYLPKASENDKMGVIDATSGSSKRKMMEADIDDTASTGPKKPRI